MNFEFIKIQIGAILTIGILSVLYRENRFFRFCEHVFIGVAMGYGLALAWTDNLYPSWWKPMTDDGHWWWAAAPVVSLLYFTIFTKKHAWMSRVIIGLLLGAASGAIFKAFAAETIPQVAGSFKPLGPNAVTPKTPDLIPANLNNLVFMITLICVMTYFFFSFEHKNPFIRVGARSGRWLLMIGFGAMFGNTVMARFSLFIGRLIFIFSEWLGISK